MSVFDKQVKVPRAVADPKTDKSLASPGLLGWGTIKTTAALAGTVGADAKLVHGDRWQQIDGNHTEQINQDVKTTILQNEARAITGNQDLATTGNVLSSITGNLNTTITGAELRTNIGVQNLTHMAPKMRMHAGEECTEEPGGFFRWIESHCEIHPIYNGEVNAIKNEVSGTSFGLVGFKCEVVQVETEVEDLMAGFHGMHLKTGGMQNFINGLACEVNGTAANIRALEAELQTRAQVPPESMIGLGME